MPELTIRNILVPEFARDNGKLRRRYREMILSLLRLAAIMAVFCPIYLVVQTGLGLAEIILLGLNIFVPLAGAVFVRLSGKFTIALYLINLSGFSLITCWAWISGGIESPVIPWLFALMALIATYGNLRATVFALAMAITANLMLLWGAMGHIIPTSVITPDVFPLIWLLSTLLALIFLFAAIAWSIERAQQAKHKLKLLGVEAEKANRVKTAFLSSMSHELRTPLNAVIGFSQVLQNDGAKNLSESQQRAIGHVYSSGKHLLALVNQILELSHIEEGETPVRLESLSLAAIYDKTRAIIQPMADENDISLSRESLEDNDHVLADKRQLAQCLLNLMSNGVKYNHPGGKVTVRWQAIGADKIRIEVADTGQGIAKKLQSQIFTPFDRLENEGGAISGTGVGLYMTKRMVENMAGSIDFTSIPGTGSTFRITLPKAPF